MIRHECDRCGVAMNASDQQRYILRIEVFAAADHLDLDAQTTSDVQGELKTLVNALARANPDDVEDRTYRLLRFDLCDACRQHILQNPLGR